MAQDLQCESLASELKISAAITFWMRKAAVRSVPGMMSPTHSLNSCRPWVSTHTCAHAFIYVRAWAHILIPTHAHIHTLNTHTFTYTYTCQPLFEVYTERYLKIFCIYILMNRSIVKKIKLKGKQHQHSCSINTSVYHLQALSSPRKL